MKQPTSDAKLTDCIYCPFFGHLNPSSISCEFLGREFGITIRFFSVSHKHNTLAMYCMSEEGHRSCPIAIANYRYYEKKEKKAKEP